MTEWEIEQEATKRINYLKTKGGWRGFIEGALWMQKQVLPQAHVMWCRGLWAIRNEMLFNF